MSRDRLIADAVEHFAQQGIGNASLRSIAAALGTSHRMLIYHFGSRTGLLAEVVRAVEQQQRDLLADLLTEDLPLAQLSERYWNQVTEAALVYGPMFFELSAHAMQNQPHTEALKADLINVWLPPLTELFLQAGLTAAHARLALAAARGLLFDLLLTGDRQAVDEASALLNQLYGL